MNLYILNRKEELVATLDSNPIIINGNSMPLLSAKVTEQLNDLSELVFETLSNAEGSDQLIEEYTVIFKNPDGSFSEFVIDKVEDSDGDIPIRSVTATSSAIELKDDIVLKEIASSTDIRVQLESLLEGTRWEVGYVDPSIYSQKLSEDIMHLSKLEALFAMQKDFSCDVYFQTVVSGQSVTKRKVSLYKQLGSSRGKRFEIGKDVVSIKRTIDTTSLKTAIIPYGKEGEDNKEKIDITSVSWSKAKGDPTDKPLGQNFLGDPEALANWGRLDKNGKLKHRFIYMEMDFDTPEQLISMAWVQLGRYNKPKLTYEADVIDLYRLTEDESFSHEYVSLGDSVLIVDNNFPNPILVNSRIVEIVRDLIDPENDSVTIGEPTGSYSKDQESALDLEELVEKAAQNAESAIEAANGKSTNYYGTKEPENPAKDDLWFRPHPDKPEEDQMLVFDGVQWQVVLDTSLATEDFHNMEKEIKEAKEKADKASISAQESKEAMALVEEEAKKATDEAIKAGVKAQESLVSANNAEKKAIESLNRAKEAKEGTDSLKLTVDSIGKEVALKATKSEVDNVRGTVQEQATKIAQNSKEISAKANQSEVNTLKGTVKEQGAKISLNAQGLASKANQSDIDTLNKTVKEQETKLTQTAKEVEVKASKSEVKEISDEIKNLEFGGTNLFKGSSNTSIGGLDFEDGSRKEYQVLNVGKSFQDNFVFGDEVTISFDIEAPKGVKRLQLYNSNNKGKFQIETRVLTNIPKGKSRQHIVTTLLERKDWNSPADWIEFFSNYGTSEWFKVSKVKIEKGNRPTDWSPAPEDMATDADVKNVEASLKVQSDAINLKANKTELDATNKKVSNNSSTLGVQAGEIKAVSSKVDKTSSELAQVKVTADRVSSEVAKKVDISKVNEAILANERIIDTRTRNDNPNYYYTNYKSRKVREFKNTSTVGLPNDGTYAVVETDVKWSDTSGGQISQIAQTDKATYQRFSTSTTAWGAWRKTADMNDINSVKTQITQLADNINARIVEKDKIISQINLSKETILIQGKNIHLDGNTKINNGIIKNAHIQDAAITSAKISQLDAGKVSVGTLSGITISGANSHWNLANGLFKMNNPSNSGQYIQIQNGKFSSYNGSAKQISIQNDELAATSGNKKIALNPERLTFTGEGYHRTVELQGQGITISSLGQPNVGANYLNAGIEIESKGTQAYIDFRTSGRKNDFDSRIKSVDGNNSNGQGTLQLEAREVQVLSPTFKLRGTTSIDFNGATAVSAPKNMIMTALNGDNSVLSIEKAGSHSNHYFNFRMRGLNHGVKDWGVSTWASDERLKRNIAPTKVVGKGLINSLNVVEFDWKADSHHEPIGLIAQEVEEVLPSAVFENLGNIKQLRPEAFIPVLIKAVQELSEENKDIRKELISLKLEAGRSEHND